MDRTAKRRALRVTTRLSARASGAGVLVALAVFGACRRDAPLTGPAAVETVAIRPLSVPSMFIGQTQFAFADLFDASHNALSLVCISWSSSDPHVARVDSLASTRGDQAQVTALAPGVAEITATCGSRTASVPVTVRPPGPVAMVDVPSTISVEPGTGVQLTVVLRDSNRVAIGNRAITFHSADTTVATASPTGMITGVAPGSTVVTASSEGKSGETQVSVRLPSFTCAPIPASQSVASAFRSTGSMHEARPANSVSLPDGRILVFGATAGALTHAEVYDPATGTFSPADGMLTTRGGYQAAALPDGRLVFLTGILLVDGRTFFPDSVPQLYDPASGTFTGLGAYAHPAPVQWETATRLQDGRVLLAGYQGSFNSTVSGATEIFDPTTGSFHRTGPMQGWSDTVGWGVLLDDGTVLFVQWSFDFALNEVELYDPTTERFHSVGCMSNRYTYSRAVRLQDGTVLITGGQMAGGNGTAEALLYLPASKSFATVASMITPRHSHAAALLRDGTVLIAGGYSAWPSATATAERYVPVPR